MEDVDTFGMTKRLDTCFNLKFLWSVLKMIHYVIYFHVIFHNKAMSLIKMRIFVIHRVHFVAIKVVLN